MASYAQQRHKLTLVPINDTKLDKAQIERELNGVYGSVGIRFDVEVDERMRGDYSWDRDGDRKLSIVGRSFFGRVREVKESAEMDYLKKTYTQLAGTLDGLYLFVVDAAQGLEDKPQSLLGEMPRRSRFGYIFSGNSPNGGVSALSHTIAHELGHGLFTLQHTFDDEYGGRKSQGQTDNLMDYATGKELAAFQWNVLANPASFTALDRGKDTQIREAGAIWMTPDWEPFICDVSDRVLSRDKEIPHGSIGGIVYKDQVYQYSSALKTYVNVEGAQLAITKPTSGDSIYLVNRDRGECGSVYRGAWAYVRSVRNINFSDSVSLRYVGPLQCFSLPNPDRIVEGGETVMYFIGESSGYKDKVLDLLYKELANKEDRNQLTQSRFSGHVCLVVTTQGENLAGNKTFADLQKSYHNVVSIQIKIEEDGTVSLVNLFTSKPLNQDGSSLDIERIKGLIQKEPWYIQAIILYELSDLLDKGIQHLKISEDIWACTGSPSIYKKLIGYVLDIFSSLVLPNNIKLSDEAKFAFLCGFWDGIVDVVQSVPQLTKLMLCAFHSDCRDNVSNQWTSFKEATIEDEQGVLICGADQYWCKAYEILAPAFKELVADDCKTAHTVGAIVGPSIAMMLGDAPAGAAVLSRLGSIGKGLWQTLQALKFCDRITDITTYLRKPLRTAIKFIRNRGTGRLDAKVTVNNTTILDVAEGQVNIKRGQTATGAPKYESLSDDQIRLVLENKDELTKIVEEVENTTKNTLDPSTNKTSKADAKISKGTRSREIIDQLKKVGEVPKDLREAIEALDEDLLAQLHYDLVVSSRSKTLREVLTSVEDLEIWKTLKQDFHKAHSMAKDSPNWERWAKSEFFKEITEKGREFGRNVTEAIKDKRLYQRLKEALGKSDLDGYELEAEVQLFIEGDRYMVADILLFKRNERGDIIDVILIENKLSSSTRFTSKQAEMFARVREAKRLEVKARSLNKATKRGEVIPLSSSQLIEIRGDGKTTGISNITINRIK